MPVPAPTAEIRLRTAFGRPADSRPHFWLTALILALLVRLLGRRAPAWTTLPAFTFDHKPSPCPHPMALPPQGRAPHAACVESGRLQDWILPGIRNRGMHPAARPARLRPRAVLARAPPGAPPLPC